MIGEPGEGWRLAMTIVSHEREPGELGYVAALRQDGARSSSARCAPIPAAFRGDQRDAVAWAHVQTEMLRLHVCRRLSERLDGVEHGPGRLDRQAADDVGRAGGRRAPRSTVAGPRAAADADDVALKTYLYSRAQSVMGGTSQIQKNIIATRILGLPTA